MSEIETVGGLARVHVRRPVGESACGAAVLGHGAGGGLRSVDLVAAQDGLLRAGWVVVLVEQPWLVAGRRIAGPPASLDAAWVPVVEALRGDGGVLADLPGPLVLGGRSAGGRVACRTADRLGADGVLLLSFPLHPPGRPDRSRAAELALVLDAGRPLAVVQGARDPMGTPDELALHIDASADGGFPQVCVVDGTHTITRGSAGRVADAVTRMVTTSAPAGNGFSGRAVVLAT